MIERPGVLDGRSAMGHNNECSLASEEVDEQLEKGIDGESLH